MSLDTTQGAPLLSSILTEIYPLTHNSTSIYPKLIGKGLERMRRRKFFLEMHHMLPHSPRCRHLGATGISIDLSSSYEIHQSKQSRQSDIHQSLHLSKSWVLNQKLRPFCAQLQSQRLQMRKWALKTWIISRNVQPSSTMLKTTSKKEKWRKVSEQSC